MRILVVGGGIFLGPAVTAPALAEGHAVSVFNRGRSAGIRSRSSTGPARTVPGRTIPGVS
jgi:uncharacterized protein YbjT (DUF2867 family)